MSSNDHVPVSKTSSFHRWLIQQQKSFRSKDCTHLLLSGGSLHIDRDEETKVLELLAEDMANGRPNYLIEHRTPVFKFCQDWDFVFPQQPPLEQFLDYMQTVQQILESCYPQLPPDERLMVICSAPVVPKKVTVKTETRKYDANLGATMVIKTETRPMEMLKCGYHVIFPNLLINKADAIRFRFILLQAMKTRFPRAFEQIEYVQNTNRASEVQFTEYTVFSNWEEVIDLSIYTKNGLRILGSSKAERCPTCKRKRPNDMVGVCQTCQGARYIDKGRPYTIMMVLDKNSECLERETDELIDNPMSAMRATSIRSTSTDTVPLKIPHWYHESNELKEALRIHVQGRKPRNTRGTDNIDGEQGLERFNAGGWGEIGSIKNMKINGSYRPCEIVDTQHDPRARCFEKFLSDHMDSGYGQIRLMRMMICSEKGNHRIFAVPQRAYCINVGRVHNSQEIYFAYSMRGGVVQRCWSSSEAGDRKCGPCNQTEARKLFDSKAVKMPLAYQKKIFPSSFVNSSDQIESRPPTPTNPPDDCRGSMEIKGDINKYNVFINWYRENSIVAKRKFSWFSEDPIAEKRQCTESSYNN